MWEQICLDLSSRDTPRSPKSESFKTISAEERKQHPDHPIAEDLVGKVRQDVDFVGSTGLEKRWKGFGGEVEPAWDGLAIEIDCGVEGDTTTDDPGWALVAGPEGSTGGWGI